MDFTFSFVFQSLVLVKTIFFSSFFFFPPGLDFIRAEGFVFSHVADEGIINACAGNLLRYRKQVGAENIQIFADIKKKHR